MTVTLGVGFSEDDRVDVIVVLLVCEAVTVPVEDLVLERVLLELGDTLSELVEEHDGVTVRVDVSLDVAEEDLVIEGVCDRVRAWLEVSVALTDDVIVTVAERVLLYVCVPEAVNDTLGLVEYDEVLD